MGARRSGSGASNPFFVIINVILAPKFPKLGNDELAEALICSLIIGATSDRHNCDKLAPNDY
jgi:hypothetical protein